MLNFPNVKQVFPLENQRLEIHYENGEVRIFDVAPYIKGSWYGMLSDPDMFATVHPIGDTVEWEDGQDIAPHELYELSIPAENTTSA